MSREAPGAERLAAFSDGVIAIILTIMVLELHVPRAATTAALQSLWPVFLSYALSYLIVAIFWTNHHHLTRYIRRAEGPVLWTNILLLFFISLIPFFTGWIAESRLAPLPTMLYAGDFVLSAGAFILFEQRVAAQLDPENLALARSRKRAVHRNWAAFTLYLLAVPVALLHPGAALGLILLNALLYLVPEARASVRRR